MENKRRPLLAGLFSLIVPGLGQLYNVQAKKAGLLLGLVLLWSVVYDVSPLASTPVGVVICVVISFGLVLLCTVDAVVLARRRKKAPLAGYNKIWVYILVAAGYFIVLFALAIAEHSVFGRYESFQVSAGSMEPTLSMGEVVWAGPLRPRSSAELRRGQVVVFRYPQDESKSFMKRIVGLPEDVLELRDGQLMINGEPVERCHVGDRRYVERNALTGRDEERRVQEYFERYAGRTIRVFQDREEGEDWGPERVPPGQVYVLGDNRDNSHDSRRWGGVPLENITAEVLFIWTTVLARSVWERIGVSPDDAQLFDDRERQAIARCRDEFGSER